VRQSNKLIVYSCRFEESTYEKLKILSGMDGRSLANYIDRICKRDIEKYEREHGEIKLLPSQSP